MKKGLRWFLGSLLVLLLLAVVAWLGRDVLLKQFVERRLEQSTGGRVAIGKLQTHFGSNTVLLQNLQLHNRAEFGGERLLDLSEIFLEGDRAELRAGRLRCRQLRLALAELHLVRDQQGRFNLDALGLELDDTTRPADAATNAAPTFAGIEHLTFSLGTIRYTDLQKPERSRRFEIGLKDEVATGLLTTEAVQEWFGSLLFRVLLQQTLQAVGAEQGRRFELIFDAEPAAGTNAPAPIRPR